MGSTRAHASRTRLRMILAGLALAASGCSLLSGQVPTVLVDYSHDEFASQFIAFFPSTVTVHPGDRIAFRQTWTGEPHTVTLGTRIDDVLDVTQPLLDQFGDLPEDQVPPEAMQEFEAALSTLPPPEDEQGAFLQTVTQPCMVAAGGQVPVTVDGCDQQELGPFDGTETFYNSGIIPFEGDGSNRFDLQLSDDIAPGTYRFLCAIHGPFQAGKIEVVPADEPIPTPREVSQAARAEIQEAAGPMIEYFERARDEGVLVVGGSSFEGNFAGLVSQTIGTVSSQVNEFLPGTVEVPVGEPVTWRMFGAHSIAFDVPEYLPIVEFAEDGSVTYNARIDLPSGGAPPLPEEEPTGPLVVDGGTWDGSGFYSSGTLWSPALVEYTMRFSTPGEYRYACLIHPPMVGTLRVTP